MALNRPWQADAERIRRKLQRQLPRECLNETLFWSLTQARTEITAWKKDYNQNTPHSSLGNITPTEFAMKMAMEKLAA